MTFKCGIYPALRVTKRFIFYASKAGFPDISFEDTLSVDRYINGADLIYFTADNVLYRVYVHDGTCEKIFQDRDDFTFLPLTNYVTIFMYPNPEFKKWLDYYGDAMPENYPSTLLYYLLDSRGGSFTEFHPSDIGYPDQLIIYNIPLEEIRPLPQGGSSSQSSSAS